VNEADDDDDDDDIFNGPDMNPQGLFSGKASTIISNK
jgi:hypothetical protein